MLITRLLDVRGLADWLKVISSEQPVGVFHCTECAAHTAHFRNCFAVSVCPEVNAVRQLTAVMFEDMVQRL